MSWPEERGDWTPYREETALEARPPRKISAIVGVILAWAIIIPIVAFLVYRVNFQPQEQEADTEHSDAKSLIVLRMQGMYLVGAYNWTGRKDAQYLKIAMSLNVGPPAQRLCAVVLLGELGDAAEAQMELRDLTEQWRLEKTVLKDQQLRALHILERLYSVFEQKRFDAPSLDDADRQVLIEELGWFGELALAPPETARTADRAAALAPAYRTVVVLVSGILVFGALFFAGSIGLLALPICALLGYVRGGLRDNVPRSGVYAETFALWLLFFLGMSWLGGWVAHQFDVRSWRLLLSGAGMLLSLWVLVWPVVRGIPWHQVKQDIGWTSGRAGAAEPLFGLGTFVLSIPLLVVGLIATLLLMALSQALHPSDPSTEQPGHPVFELLQNANWWEVAQAFFAASIVAPIVEETMFRGVLYRQLRSATAGGGFVLSFLASMVVVSFLFAVIHPQGWVATPALMAIAFALTIAREWRVSLLPGMVHHGIHNGCLLALALVILN
jgi:membrane protease YdiL (CAAX protease family)